MLLHFSFLLLDFPKRSSSFCFIFSLIAVYRIYILFLFILLVFTLSFSHIQDEEQI